MTPDLVRTIRRRLTLNSLAALLAVPAVAQGPMGRLEGRISDQAGQPIANASVVLEGTAFRSAANRQGFYVINRVPSGTYTARVTYVGYQPIEVDSVVIRAGVTTQRDFVLTQTATDIEELTVVAAGSVLVPRDQVTGKQLISGAYTDRLPKDNLGNVFAMQPGVMASPGNTIPSVRGARVDERNTYVDGVPVSPPDATRQFNTESYDRIVDNPFLAAAVNPLSTFGVDVDRASYANVRRFISAGQRPPKDAVRIEELVNYFSYDNPAPTPQSRDPFTVTTEVAAAPWAPTHRLVRIALQARRIDTRDLPPANLVFLLDVSGSMQSANKLPLVKTSLRMLVEQLREQDRVAIVVYAGAAGLVLPPTSGADKPTILTAIDRLEAGGSTAGGAGLRLAYQVAREHLITSGNNRVILATDGDFNVGVSSDAEMERLVEGERQHGVFLTVLGFGMGNYKDSKLETLADKGNGNYAYIDTPLEARKTLVSEFGGTLFTVAKDVKLQVEFNPARVQGYRLLGYENRMLRSEDFNDDTKDAGDVGAGHAVTALYEVVPTGIAPDVAIRGIDSLRYVQASATGRGRGNNELLFVKLRYKDPDGETSRLLTHPVLDRVRAPSSEFRFAAAVAAFGMILRESEYRGSASTEQVLGLARHALGPDPEGYRAGFVTMVERYRQLAAVTED